MPVRVPRLCAVAECRVELQLSRTAARRLSIQHYCIVYSVTVITMDGCVYGTEQLFAVFVLVLQPRYWICNAAHLVPVPSQDKVGLLHRKGIRHKNGGMMEMGR